MGELLTCKEISERLNISYVELCKHLVPLRNDDLKKKTGARGRPSYVFDFLKVKEYLQQYPLDIAVNNTIEAARPKKQENIAPKEAINAPMPVDKNAQDSKYDRASRWVKENVPRFIVDENGKKTRVPWD